MLLRDYKVIRKELSAYPEILEKKEYIVLTKSDTVNTTIAKQVQEKVEKELDKEILSIVSIIDDESIKTFGDTLIKVLRDIKK